MDNKIIVFTKPGCPYCKNAKQLLGSLDLPFNEIVLNPNDLTYEYKKNRLFDYYNHRSYPIIVIDNILLGGYTELLEAYRDKSLHKICSKIGLHIRR